MRAPVIGIVLASLPLMVAGCATTPTPSSPSSTVPTVATVPGDVDGDGAADSITQKRVDGRWQLVVGTRSGTFVHVFDTGSGPEGPDFVGTAPLDPVPGVEVIYTSPDEDPGYRVLTWRDGGLVVSPSPKGSPTWVTDDEFNIHTGYKFSEVDGKRRLFTSENSGWDAGPVTFVEYAWVSGAWAVQRSWSEELDREKMAWLCASFCGVRLSPVAPS